MDFKYKFHVWAGYDVQVPILAFLRTSESGEWKVDPEKENDALMMNLKRGNWGLGKRFARFFGSGVEFMDQPAQVRVVLRPDNSKTRVVMEVCYPFFNSYGYKVAEENITEFVDSEIEKLKSYIIDFHGLSDLGPEVKEDHA